MNPNKLSTLLKRKYLPFLIVILAIIFLLTFSLLKSSSNQESDSLSPAQSGINPQSTESVQENQNTPGTGANQPIELQQAIDEAKESAKEYDDWQANLQTNYPWLRRLPLAGDKYYVYFDLNTEMFIVLLYPSAGDNLAQLKVDVSDKLFNMGINPEEYQFEWRVSNQ